MTLTSYFPDLPLRRLAIPDFIRMGKRMLAATFTPDDSHELTSRFQVICSRYDDVISRICFSYGGLSPQDREDLRQDILINIWRGLPKFRAESEEITWIYRVALNTCVSTVRKRKSHPAEVDIDKAFAVSDDTTLDQEQKERLLILNKMIEALSPLDKAVITMRLDDRSYEEIAAVTGISKSNVAVRLHRIKASMQTKINQISSK